MRKALESVGWFALTWAFFLTGGALVMLVVFYLGFPLIFGFSRWFLTGVFVVGSLPMEAFFVRLSVGFLLFSSIGSAFTFWKRNYPRDGKAWWAK